jgi:hypothetical protein
MISLRKRRLDAGSRDWSGSLWILKTLLTCIALLPLGALADIAVWEPLTKETLVGTWEAVMPIESTMVAGLYRMEIRKEGDSYLVGIITQPNESPWERFALRVTAADVSDGKIKLSFRGQFEGKEAEVTFNGSGAGLTGQGAIGGRFSVPNGTAFDGYSGDIWFRKGSWTHDLERTSKEAEKLIQRLQTKPKS